MRATIPVRPSGSTGPLLRGLLLGLLASTAWSSTTSDLDHVLTEARAAARRQAWPAHGLELTGSSRMQGIDYAMQLRLGKGGEYRLDLEGPLGSTSASDGELAWSRPHRGPARRLGREESHASALAQWVHSGFWLDERAPLALALVEADERRAVLDVTPEGSPKSVQLVLDPETWLPRELVRETAGGAQVTTFADYRDVAGVPLAHEITSSQSGVNGFVHVETGSAARAPGRYALDDTAGSADTRFDPSVPPEVEIRRVASGHLLVHPVVDGEDLGWFILDTGAGRLCIDATVAEKAGMERFGEVPAMGLGGVVKTGFRQGRTLTLGPITITDPAYVELDLAFLEPFFGTTVAGICGYDLFARSVFELDLEEPSGAIFDPATYELGEGEWSELLLEDRLPAVRCRFEGDRDGVFKIDTGATGTVSFNHPAVESLGLLDGRETTASQLGGVGGMTTVAIGQMAWFEVGGRRFEAIEASFAVESVGVLGEHYVVGTLGGALLQPFRVVFDYGGGRIAFTPRDGGD